VRFVVDPDGTVVPDIAGRLPGRGLWVAPDRALIARAAARGLFARAAHRSVRAPADLPETVERLLRQSCIGLIALARRAGQAVAGYEKVRGAVRDGRVALLLEASDGAADGRGKILALAGGLGWDVAVADVLDADALGVAFGRERVVHAAIAPGGIAGRLTTELARLTGVRGATAIGRDAPAPDLGGQG
jgi:predicted RNA-binding protein YlxR (DUF448 family)